MNYNPTPEASQQDISDNNSKNQSANIDNDIENDNEDKIDSFGEDVDSSLQNTIWRIADCSVYTKPTWTKTSWEEKQIFMHDSKVFYIDFYSIRGF